MPAYERMEVGIVGDEVGDQGSSVSWRLGLVRKEGDIISYQDLGDGTPQSIEASLSQTLTLVVMPIAPEAGWGEQFSYEYLFVEYQEDAVEPGDEAPKLGCDTINRGASFWMFMLVLCGLRTRYKY
jgi:hypothetical protein